LKSEAFVVGMPCFLSVWDDRWVTMKFCTDPITFLKVLFDLISSLSESACVTVYVVVL